MVGEKEPSNATQEILVKNGDEVAPPSQDKKSNRISHAAWPVYYTEACSALWRVYNVEARAAPRVVYTTA